MNRRRAKREACFIASRWIYSTLSVDPVIRVDGEALPADHPDREKILDGIRELVQELQRRGGVFEGE